MIHNNWKVWTTQISIKWYMDKQNVVCPYNRILLGNKNEWSTDACYNVDEIWKHYTKWKKLVIKDHIVCDSIYMNCLE